MCPCFQRAELDRLQAKRTKRLRSPLNMQIRWMRLVSDIRRQIRNAPTICCIQELNIFLRQTQQKAWRLSSDLRAPGTVALWPGSAGFVLCHSFWPPLWGCFSQSHCGGSTWHQLSQPCLCCSWCNCCHSGLDTCKKTFPQAFVCNFCSKHPTSILRDKCTCLAQGVGEDHTSHPLRFWAL